jgi:hypothetical protein
MLQLACVKQDHVMLAVARIKKILVTAVITSRTVTREESVLVVNILIRTLEGVKISALLVV